MTDTTPARTADLLPAVLEAVAAAGTAILEVYAGSHAVEYKADDSPITRADRAAHEILAARLGASTNRHLQKEVEANRFREDLYYRLNVVEIHLPPLSDRKEDIPLLVEHFINKYRAELRRDVKGVDADVMRTLMSHVWKGEVRELSNIVERAVIFCKGKFVTLGDLPDILRSSSRTDFPDDNKPLQQAMNELERTYIERVLRKHDFDKEQTATVLGISLPTLYRRIKELGIPQE